MQALRPSVAIVDLETTGLFPYRHDRIVEVAVVVVDLNGQTLREFVSLVNPARDIGSTRVHGLTAKDVLQAPTFENVAPHLISAVSGVVAIVAHNVRFDTEFLHVEFNRAGFPLPEFPKVCTMRLAGGLSLADSCDAYGIELENAHHALADARATAKLFSAFLADATDWDIDFARLDPIEWPEVVAVGLPPVTRADSLKRQSEPPTFLQALRGRASDGTEISADDSAVMAYEALLYRVLEDRHIDDLESEALIETATRWGLTTGQVERAHHNYLYRLAVTAVADEVVTDAERRDLDLVAQLLGQDSRYFDEVLAAASRKVAETNLCAFPITTNDESLIGKSVCFTGEILCRVHGKPITRSIAEDLARQAGLVILQSVTKKLDILVLADPNSQSGKAKKARQYGTRLLHEKVFLTAIGVAVE